MQVNRVQRNLNRTNLVVTNQSEINECKTWVREKQNILTIQKHFTRSVISYYHGTS